MQAEITKLKLAITRNRKKIARTQLKNSSEIHSFIENELNEASQNLEKYNSEQLTHIEPDLSHLQFLSESSLTKKKSSKTIRKKPLLASSKTKDPITWFIPLLICMIVFLLFSTWKIHDSISSQKETSQSQIIPKTISVTKGTPPLDPKLIQTDPLKLSPSKLVVSTRKSDHLINNNLGKEQKINRSTPSKEAKKTPKKIEKLESIKTSIYEKDRVATAKLAPKIENRNPVGSFSKPIILGDQLLTKIYFSTTIKSSSKNKFFHIWSLEGKEIARVALNVTSNFWRGNSSKLINRQMTGRWQVKLIDTDQKILAESNFEVKL